MDFQLTFNGTYIDIADDFVTVQVQNHLRIAIIFLAAISAATYTILSPFFPDLNSLEPISIPQKIPYVGHVLGLARSGITYYLELSSMSSLPIYSLQMLAGKIYVVNSPELVSVVQRNSKTLSPYPFIMAYLQPLLGLDNPTLAIIKHNMYSRDSYAHEVHSMHQQTMSPGATLNQMQNRAFDELSSILNDANDPISTSIYSWVQEIFMKFNTTAVWGPENPFRVDPSFAKAFWNVEANFHMLILNLLPSWTAGGALQDREKLVELFVRYHNTVDLSQSCQLVQQWVRIGNKYGLSTEALARIDIGLAQALLVNTVPIATWMLLRIFSNHELLAELRVEVERLQIENISDPNESRVLLDFTRIKESCPLLVSTWQEVLRMNSYLPSGRAVLQDTTVQGRYLLKKDATVLIFSGVLHSDAKSWGPDVAEFNPRRFLRGESQTKVHSAAFRPFGGGHVLCPGRIFAFTEVLTFVATVILGFDIGPEGGVWPSLERDVYRPSLGVYKPKKQSNTGVTVSRRPRYKNRVWKYPLQPEV